MEGRNELLNFTIPQLLRWRVNETGDKVALQGNLDPVVLEGQSDYAGLTAVLEYAQDDVTEPYKHVAGFGYIVGFEMPDPPEPFVK